MFVIFPVDVARILRFGAVNVEACDVCAQTFP